MTIVEFLLARLAEEEAAVRAARPGEHEENRRAWADVTGRRALVEHMAAPQRDRLRPEDRFSLRTLAARYVDHPDYRPEWAPTTGG